MDLTFLILADDGCILDANKLLALGFFKFLQDSIGAFLVLKRGNNDFNGYF